MNPFKLGVIVDSFRKPFNEAIEAAARLGAQGVQMYVVSGPMSWENFTAEKSRDVKNALRDNGMEFSALCGDLGGHGFELAEDNPKKIETSKRIMELAVNLGTAVVTTHIGVIPDDPGHDRYKIMETACGELGLYAEKLGVRFAIETGPEKASTLKSFLDRIGGKGLAVNFDPANFVMVTGQDPVEGVGLLRDYIVHTHAKDGKMFKQTDPKILYDAFAGTRVPGLRIGDYFIETALGQGDVDFDAYLSALAEVGYNGYLTVEREVGDDPAGDIGLALTLLREKMEKLSR